MRVPEKHLFLGVLLFAFGSFMNPLYPANRATGSTPNVIFFVMDDLNDWVNPLGYSQVKTPNLDRLANTGVTFTNAHAPGVFCSLRYTQKRPKSCC
jgi:hypothetical protein